MPLHFLAPIKPSAPSPLERHFWEGTLLCLGAGDLGQSIEYVPNGVFSLPHLLWTQKVRLQEKRGAVVYISRVILPDHLLILPCPNFCSNNSDLFLVVPRGRCVRCHENAKFVPMS